MSHIMDYLENKTTVAVSIDAHSESYVITYADITNINKTYITNGRCELGNAIGEFIAFDFDRIRSELTGYLCSGDSMSDIAASIYSSLNRNCNPGNDIISIDNDPHVNLFLFSLYSEIFNMISGFVPYDSSLSVIDKYKELQVQLKEYYSEILSLPKDSELLCEYNKLVNTSKMNPFECNGSIRMIDIVMNLDGSWGPKKWFFGESFEDIIDFLLIHYISSDLHFKTCNCCGRPFAMIKKYNAYFCNRSIDDIDTDRTCKNYGRYFCYGITLKKNPISPQNRKASITELYKRAYKTHHARIKSHLMTHDEFNSWVSQAQTMKEDALRGNMTEDAFREWINSDRIRKTKKKRTD